MPPPPARSSAPSAPTSPDFLLLDILDKYHRASETTHAHIAQRIGHYTHQVADAYDQLARQVATLPGVHHGACVRSAFAASTPRAATLIAQALPAFDSSTLAQAALRSVQAMAEEVAIYIGGGLVLGAVVGGAGGALAGGVGAIPGALAGASAGAAIGGEVMLYIGLGSLARETLHGIGEMAQHFAQGFALAWQAAPLKDTAPGRYVADMARAADAFARGQLTLLVAILGGVMLVLSRGQVAKTALYRELTQSKLGLSFAGWLAANEAALARSALLQPRSAPVPSRPPVRPTPLPVDKAPEPTTKPAADKRPEGRGKSCKSCTTTGYPVNPIFGSKLLAGDTERDFAFAAPLPLLWQRQYSSDNPVVGWLGQGWSVPVSLALQLHADQVVVLDAQHRNVTFSLPAIGQSLYSPYEQVTLSRPQALRFELTDADQTRHLFTLPDRHAAMACLSAIIDRNGNTTRIQYDHLQQPVRIVDSAGRTYQLTFAHQRLQTVALLRETPGDLVPHRFEPLVHYDYDAAGDLVRVRNRLGEVTREFAYRQHLLVRHSRPGGLVAEYAYDHYRPDGKVIRHWANTGESWTFDYRAHETLVTDGLGRTRRYRFDDEQRLTGETDPMGGRTERVLDRYGNLVAITDAAGRTTRYRHDARSLLTRIELPDGSATRIVQDGRVGKPALVTDAAGNISAYRYDARGNLASITDALGHQTRYRYDAQGLPVAIIDAHGKTKTLAYNPAGQVLRYTDCSGQVTTFDYDLDGRLTATTNALGERTGYDYDALGQLAAVHYPDGSSERHEYDALGRLTAHTDGAGQRTTYAFDVDGKPLVRTNALGHAVQYRYDDARRLAQLVNENGAVYAFAYDAADRLVQEIGFDARLTRYRYDASGLAIGREEFGTVPGVVQFDDHRVESKISTLYGRDLNGRLVDKIVSQLTGAAQAEQLHTSYGYDALGRLVQARNGQATVQLQYDALGQLLSETTTADSVATTLSHAYDALGNRVQTILPDGRVLQQLFYGSGHLHQVRLGEEVITDIERDAAHREISRTQGALTSQFEYDPMGRLKAQLASLEPGSNSSQSLAQQRTALDALEHIPHESAAQIGRQYAYDRAGNLVTIDDARLGRTRYTYDRIGRLLSALQPHLSERFAFDPAHNLLDPQASDSGSSAGRLVNNRLTVYEDKRYGYDTHGNLVDKRVGRHTQVRLKWNAEHQLVESQVSRNAQADAPTVQKTRYGYDPFGRRLYKRDAFGVTRFVWDGNRLLSETRGSQIRTWVYEADSFVPIAQVESATAASAPCDAQPQKTPNVRHIHTDHLGTPRELTSGSGEIVWAGVHKAWGNLAMAAAVQVANDQDTAADTSAFTDAQPLRFQGQYYDSETGLHYNRFRYYDPDSGRFVSQDPIGLQGGNNLYQYAPNPISWIDPFGLSCRCGSGENPKGSFSQLVEGGGLAAHEAKGGHLLLKHVGKSEAELASRLRAEPRISAASTFLNREEAEAAMVVVLDARASELSAWTASGARGKLVLNAPFNGGMVLQRDATASTKGTGATGVLRGIGAGKWKILTGYPTP